MKFGLQSVDMVLDRLDLWELSRGEPYKKLPKVIFLGILDF
jgi:hypothetical protein